VQAARLQRADKVLPQRLDNRVQVHRLGQFPAEGFEQVLVHLPPLEEEAIHCRLQPPAKRMEEQRQDEHRHPGNPGAVGGQQVGKNNSQAGNQQGITKRYQDSQRAVDHCPVGDDIHPQAPVRVNDIPRRHREHHQRNEEVCIGQIRSGSQVHNQPERQRQVREQDAPVHRTRLLPFHTGSRVEPETEQEKEGAQTGKPHQDQVPGGSRRTKSQHPHRQQASRSPGQELQPGTAGHPCREGREDHSHVQEPRPSRSNRQGPCRLNKTGCTHGKACHPHPNGCQQDCQQLTGGIQPLLQQDPGGASQVDDTHAKGKQEQPGQSIHKQGCLLDKQVEKYNQDKRQVHQRQDPERLAA